MTECSKGEKVGREGPEQQGEEPRRRSFEGATRERDDGRALLPGERARDRKERERRGSSRDGRRAPHGIAGVLAGAAGAFVVAAAAVSVVSVSVLVVGGTYNGS